MSTLVWSQYDDPNFPIPSSGYGSEGPYTVAEEAFPNPYFPEMDIHIYHPAEIETPVPTIFYSHAFGGNFPAHIQDFLDFVAKKGYAVVFVPYETLDESVLDRYENLREGFRKSALDFPNIIDTSRVGFMGHSFGGGASFGIARKLCVDYQWGQSGRFIHSSAPWYSYDITQEELQSFPEDMKLVVEVYHDDPVNDHRMAVDMFENINITDSEKDFIMVMGDTINDYIYTAQHDLPTGTFAVDAMDYYAYYRIVDALCDYTFNGNLDGKAVALGDGGSDQVTMPGDLIPLVQTDDPYSTHPEEFYGFPCTALLNPRSEYCGLVGVNEPDFIHQKILVFPNPSEDVLCVKGIKDMDFQSVEVYDLFGQRVFCKILKTSDGMSIDVQSLSSGTYCIQMGSVKFLFVKA